MRPAFGVKYPEVSIPELGILGKSWTASPKSELITLSVSLASPSKSVIPQLHKAGLCDHGSMDDSLWQGHRIPFEAKKGEGGSLRFVRGCVPMSIDKQFH